MIQNFKASQWRKIYIFCVKKSKSYLLSFELCKKYAYWKKNSRHKLFHKNIDNKYVNCFCSAQSEKLYLHIFLKLNILYRHILIRKSPKKADPLALTIAVSVGSLKAISFMLLFRGDWWAHTLKFPRPWKYEGQTKYIKVTTYCHWSQRTKKLFLVEEMCKLLPVALLSSRFL
jgi:hypothetical protein